MPDEFTPENTVFVSLSFEGPDQYSQAGGLGVRVTELDTALAMQGFETHLVFVGDPTLPGREERADGRLTLHRWGQWLSQYYPAGVYQGEEAKLHDYNGSAPSFVADSLLAPAIQAGKTAVVIAEEWHTAEALCRLSDTLHGMGLRDRAVLMWNANNLYGFWRIDWDRLSFVAAVTTVSKYMKHRMWAYGLDPLVIPNGIPARFLDAPDEADVAAVRAIFDGQLTLFKIGRFDPDKRWLMAVESAAALRRRGVPVRLLMRGGIEPHGHEVLQRAWSLGLSVHDVRARSRSMADCIAALREAPPADVLNLSFFLPEAFVRTLYRAADAVLANSAHEPFGLVGLEVMGAGGTAVTGSTGEDYAVHLENAVVIDTDDPNEIAEDLLYLREHPTQVERLRAGAAATARQFTWDEVLHNLFAKTSYVAQRQGVRVLPPPPPSPPPVSMPDPPPVSASEPAPGTGTTSQPEAERTDAAPPAPTLTSADAATGDFATPAATTRESVSPAAAEETAPSACVSGTVTPPTSTAEATAQAREDIRAQIEDGTEAPA